MGEISARIDSIVKARNANVPSIQEAIDNLDNSIAAIKLLEAKQADCIRGTFKTDDEICERIKALSFDKFYNAANRYRTKLLKLKDRFSRNSLHISLVGRARMGKSLVIQRITGLDSTIIPSADALDCTGTKSSITNAESSDVTAQITFFTEYELINIVNTYLENILHSKSMSISSVSQIASFDIDKIKLDYSQIKEAEYFRHLKKYIDHIDEFKSNLGKTIEVKKEDIEKYVAQYSHSDFNIKYFNFLGVKSANICTRFPCNDAGKIVLLDTIGIGTTSLGVEEDMLNVVEKDSDAVIFMFRPDALGPKIGDNEVDAIDKISKRVGPEYAKEMLFWVINKVVDGKGKNDIYLDGVLDQINSSSWPVSEIYLVNCMDQAEVEQKLLMPLLDKISSNITAVDKLIVDTARADGQSAYAEYNAICSAIDKLFMNCVTEDMKKAWFKKIKNIRDILIMNNLRNLYKNKYKENMEHPSEDFKSAADAIMDKLFSFIPETSSVVELLKEHNAQQTVLMICYDRLRLNIIDAFLSLDTNLDEMITRMKNEVLDIFMDSDKGRLSLIVSKEEAQNAPEEWIKLFIEKTEADTKYKTIADALTKFKDFRCTVQGFLIYEIRSKLDKIDQSLITLPEIGNMCNDMEYIANCIVEILNDSVSDIYSNLRSKINELSRVPNQAMFAAIKDLYDRIFLESRDEVCNYDSNTQWRYLYEDWMHIIWKNDYDKEISTQNKARELNDIINGIKKFNKPAYFEAAVH